MLHLLHYWTFFAHAAQRAARAYRDWRRAAIAHREVQLLDDHALRDLGLSHRAAIEPRS